MGICFVGKVGIKESELGTLAVLGLWAMVAINGKTSITEYGGIVINDTQRLSLTSKYILTHPSNIHLHIDASDPLCGYGRYANDPLCEDMENAKFTYEGRTKGQMGTAILRATRFIPAGHEIYVAYGGEYWADASHPLEIRRKAAERYPEWARQILHAGGEGDCNHTTCIQKRATYLQTQLDRANRKSIPDPDPKCHETQQDKDPPHKPRLQVHTPTKKSPTKTITTPAHLPRPPERSTRSTTKTTTTLGNTNNHTTALNATRQPITDIGAYFGNKPSGEQPKPLKSRRRKPKPTTQEQPTRQPTIPMAMGQTKSGARSNNNKTCPNADNPPPED